MPYAKTMIIYCKYLSATILILSFPFMLFDSGVSKSGYLVMVAISFCLTYLAEKLYPEREYED